jgi:hypothetical protein
MRLQREMSITPADFQRVLRLAAPSPVVLLPGGELLLEHAGVRLTVRLTPLPARVIAGLSLPCLLADYCLEGPAPEAAALLAALDLGMRRGGG